MSHCFLIRTTCSFWTHSEQKIPAIKEECAPELRDVQNRKREQFNSKLCMNMSVDHARTALQQCIHVKQKCITSSHIQPVVVHTELKICSKVPTGLVFRECIFSVLGIKISSCRCVDPEVRHPGWWSYLQQPAAERQQRDPERG